MTTNTDIIHSMRNHILAYNDPHNAQPLSDHAKLQDISLKTDAGPPIVSAHLTLGYPITTLAAEYRDALTKHWHRVFDEQLQLKIDWQIKSHVAQKSMKPLASVKNVLAVAAAKGGVGKSTVAAHLAVQLAEEGAKVGIVDADIYGPSIPQLFGLSGNPETKDGKRFEPFIRYGVKVMSVGFLVDEKTAMIWRGPMASAALNQLVSDTNWGELDYLIVDLPPGTGDIPLTLAQKVPVTGAVLVTTPQSLSIADVKRGIAMFQRLEIAILGIVENMSYITCGTCNSKHHLFGKGAVQSLADENLISHLTTLPLTQSISQSADLGEPVPLEHGEATYRNFQILAARATSLLSLRARDYSGKFPKITVKGTAPQHSQQQ